MEVGLSGENVCVLLTVVVAVTKPVCWHNQVALVMILGLSPA